MTSPRSAPNTGESRSSVSENLGLAVAAVARRLGVAPATLRTWDRRYGLGPSEHQAGAHRRYTKDDFARLLIMRRLTLEGVAPVDAARAALAASTEELASEEDPQREEADSAVSEPESEPEAASSAPEEATSPAAADVPNLDESRGRRVLRALPGGRNSADPASRTAHADPSAREPGQRPGGVSEVIDAAVAYDQRACDRLLRLRVGDDPGLWWADLVNPALERLAERTVLAGAGEVPEVILANATLSALRQYAMESEEALVAAGGPPRNHPSRMRKIVLVFAAPDEPLPLAAHALAAALGAHGAMARIVTGPANVHRTLELVMMVRPAAVAMVTNQTRPDLTVVHSMHEENPELPVFVGMRRDEAADQLPLSPTVQRIRSFTALLYELLAVVS